MFWRNITKMFFYSYTHSSLPNFPVLRTLGPPSTRLFGCIISNRAVPFILNRRLYIHITLMKKTKNCCLSFIFHNWYRNRNRNSTQLSLFYIDSLFNHSGKFDWNYIASILLLHYKQFSTLSFLIIIFWLVLILVNLKLK